MQASDHFNGKVFQNPVPTEVMGPGSFLRVMREFFKNHPGREPEMPLGPFKTDNNVLATLSPQALGELTAHL